VQLGSHGPDRLCNRTEPMLTAGTGSIELDEGNHFSISRLNDIYGEVHGLGTLATGAINLLDAVPPCTDSSDDGIGLSTVWSGLCTRESRGDRWSPWTMSERHEDGGQKPKHQPIIPESADHQRRHARP
jgi:hypothetical protein